MYGHNVRFLDLILTTMFSKTPNKICAVAIIMLDIYTYCCLMYKSNVGSKVKVGGSDAIII